MKHYYVQIRDTKDQVVISFENILAYSVTQAEQIAIHQYAINVLGLTIQAEDLQRRKYES